MKHLILFNDHFNDQLCRYLDHDEYLYWKSKIANKLNDKVINLFKEQIVKFLDEYKDYQTFDEEKIVKYKHRITFNGNPLYGPSDPYLKMAMEPLNDDWYLIEVYFNWAFYTFLCDDIIGLESLSNEMLKIIDDNNLRFDERFSFFKKKVDDHITEQDLERVYDVVDMFAAENNLGQKVIWDKPGLKEIDFYTKYSDRGELEIAHNDNTDINFKFYSNNLEFITIEDRYGFMNLEDKYPSENKLLDKILSLVSRIRKMCPDLKVKCHNFFKQKTHKGLPLSFKFYIKITK